MSVSPEDLAAFADGQLEGERAGYVAAAIARDPALAAALQAHEALRQRLTAHFAPVLEAALPERLTAPLENPHAEVTNLAGARERRAGMSRLPRWSWIAAPALAASLALALLVPRGSGAEYADGALAGVLGHQLVVGQENTAPTRILLSFKDRNGAFCRAFAGEARSGIACRDALGWRLDMTGEGVANEAEDYRMAGSAAAQVFEHAQAMASGPALDAVAERAARARDWR